MHHLVLNLSILNHIVTCHYFTIFMQKINKNLAGPTSEECSHCVQCCGSVSRSRFLTLKLQLWFCFRLEPWPRPLLWPRHDLDLDLELDNFWGRDKYTCQPTGNSLDELGIPMNPKFDLSHAFVASFWLIPGGS